MVKGKVREEDLMFAKLFGGPVVQLVEYENGRLLFRSKKPFESGQLQDLKVAGREGKPARIKAVLKACRPIEDGGYACSAGVDDPGYQRELSRLSAYSQRPQPGLRQWVRKPRQLDIESPDFQATSIDISAGGMQVRTASQLSTRQTLRIVLAPGLNCTAKVAWVRGERAGLEFCQEDSVTQMLLERFASGRACCSTTDKNKPALDVIAPPSYQSYT